MREHQSSDEQSKTEQRKEEDKENTASGYRDRAATMFSTLQSNLCAALASLEVDAKFSSDAWERPTESGSYGGGGLTRVLSGGAVFEQAGIGFSKVSGDLPAEMGQRLVERNEVLPFFAVGVSLVVHPRSPFIPTTHLNYRYLEVGEQRWFGGGMDLTPYYLDRSDAAHFHTVLRHACDTVDRAYYPRFKRWCDEYFYLPHRGEGRGVGGLFFDYLGRNDETELHSAWDLISALQPSFLEAYLPIVERHRSKVWTEEERHFQLVRRGRYVEYNLLYDRGTLFGLKTGGRIESILMSLPPEVRWEYRSEILQGSREAQLLEVLRSPCEWAILLSHENRKHS